MGSQKKQKQKQKQSDGSKSNEAVKMVADPRFSGVHSDPRFQNVPKHKSKVAIDSRFDRVFSDNNFSSSSLSIDKRGKAKNKTSTNTLRHYYRLDEEEEQQGKRKKKKTDTVSEDDDDDEELELELEEHEEEDSRTLKLKKPKKPSHTVSSEFESSEDSEVSESEEDNDDVENGVSESTTDTDTDEDGVDDVYMEDEDEVQEENIPVIEKETHRLAVVNMDWSHVKAVDLYMMLSSFLPKEGHIVSVSVYPSEFGLERMKEEEVHGPVGLFDDEDKKNGEDDDDDEDDDDEIDDEKLRAYEKSRMKYYFAVVECDSIATADYLYKSCDGVEFERSSNVLDLRFIPDTVEFKHPPRDVATEAPADYVGLDFETQALQQSKIHLTWDEDEPHRVRTLKRKFNDDQLADMELKEFLASSEGETDDDDDDDDEDNASENLKDRKHKKRDLYRSLVQSGGGSDEDGSDDGQDMEVTFNTGLEDISKRILEKKDAQSESVWDAYLRKRREKKKARKNKSNVSSGDESSDTDQEVPEDADDFFISEPSTKRSKESRSKRVNKQEQEDADNEAEASRAELELLLADDKETNPGVKGYNLKRMKSKGKKGKQEQEEDKIPTADYDDPRFSSLFKSPLFALDPTDPQFKRSAAYARQVAAQKQQKTNRGKLDRDDMLAPSDAGFQSNGPQENKDEQTKLGEAQTKKDKLELSSLVRSVKMKAKQVQVPSDRKTSKTVKRSQSSSGLVEDKHSVSPLTQPKKKKSKAPKN